MGAGGKSQADGILMALALIPVNFLGPLEQVLGPPQDLDSGRTVHMAQVILVTHGAEGKNCR